MQITPKNQVSGIDAYNLAQVQNKQKVGTEESNTSDGSTLKADTVVLSDAAKRIQEAQARIQTLPDVRNDKVAELKAQIENGTYEIKSEEIAEKMIRESLLNELLT
jgi:negative regulator of flagellin synthesis FlgM